MAEALHGLPPILGHDDESRHLIDLPLINSRIISALPGHDLSTAEHWTMDDFVIVRTLGHGTFARVCLVQLANPQNEIDSRKIMHVWQERKILRDVSDHPFITKLLGSFSDLDSLYLVLEYVPGGELFTYLRQFHRLDEEAARFYAAKIVLVFEYLHWEQGGVVYRDLKPENLLLDEDGHIKLADFGFAKRLQEQNYPTKTYTLCGTPEYLAPEVLYNNGYTTTVDWWSLGILIYEFLVGNPPFWSGDASEIYKQILKKPITFPRDLDISNQAKDLIQSLCNKDPSRRLGSHGSYMVKDHPFFRGVNWSDVYNRRFKGPIQPPVRFPGDSQCFVLYPEIDPRCDAYSIDMKEEYDSYFKDF
ncbi:hypothetical protein FJTKL_07168 [Diaporthe vaccinii]|uniref:cAMP-dependent protein kinase n=1 Tax=Diaporthe vaccinii TaxID=105482 RepID=A0ABR4DPQ6_9PEZI